MAKQRSSEPAFLLGLDLAERFYWEAVRPILEEAFPGLRHAAALIGPGSEVLGFDTEMSADHGWGPRVLLFVSASDHASKCEAIRRTLGERLPRTFLEFSTHFSEADPLGARSQVLRAAKSGLIRHRVESHTLGAYFESYLGVNLDDPLQPEDWLVVPQQKLLSVVSGRVFHDDLGLEGIRRRLAWYPHDVWLYLLASGWSRIGEDEHLMGRAGFVGDELGSQVIAARLVRDVMRLALLMERAYAPYAKWLGTAFRRLHCSASLHPMLEAVMRASTWHQRDAGLAAAYERLAVLHDDLRLTSALPTRSTAFHDRPFHVIHGERFAKALVGEIQDTAVSRIASKRLIGNVDFISDNTDLLEDTARLALLRPLYR